MKDVAIAKLIEQETVRQRDGLEMIPSENHTSGDVMAALGSRLTDKYSEGYPGMRYYGGCEYVDIIEQLTNSLKDGDSIPRDAAVVVELLKKIFQTPYCRYMDQFVSMALRVNLPTLVLNKILGASAADLSHVANLPALRIHAVDLLKAILAAGDEASVAQLQALLDLHPAWRDFKHQSHDLFLTVRSLAWRPVSHIRRS